MKREMCLLRQFVLVHIHAIIQTSGHDYFVFGFFKNTKLASLCCPVNDQDKKI